MATRNESPTAAGPPADAAGEPLAFEAAMRELESIVEQMEAGALGLEESLAAYRRGAELVSRCRDGLARVQQQVRVLEADLLKPFDVDADAER
jgi:exodeoxyribonuclease VII small subunit